MSLGPNSFRPAITKRVRRNSRSAMFAYNAARTRKIVSKPFIAGGQVAKYTYNGARVFSTAHPIAARAVLLTGAALTADALVVGALHANAAHNRRVYRRMRAAGYEQKYGRKGPKLTTAQRQLAARKRRRVQGRFA